MRKRLSMSLFEAIFLLIAGAFLGTVFTFGMQHWDQSVSREECRAVESGFVSHKEDRRLKRPTKVQQIILYCEDGENYTVDGVSVSDELLGSIRALEPGEKLQLLIHPNSDTIVELTVRGRTLLEFDTTIGKLGDEKTGFLILGIGLYACAFAGLCGCVCHGYRYYKSKR